VAVAAAAVLLLVLVGQEAQALAALVGVTPLMGLQVLQTEAAEVEAQELFLLAVMVGQALSSLRT
tara:strand:- start:1631 stop:1825 length:195 start_codon:yes stop_codon:yes gene_type:complete